jgi:DNA polymerase III subunit delta'
MSAANRNETAETLLRRSLERGRLGHSYLFSGDDINQLEEPAVRLAQTVNCEFPERSPQGGPVAPCGKCRHCRLISERIHPDVQWVRPENKMRMIGVEPTREVIRILSLRPTEATRKVAVFCGADRLGPNSANAFLKTLEEPPGGSLIILLTTEPDRMMETIVSRCLRLSFGFGRIALDEPIHAWVSEFAEMARPAKPDLLGRYRLLGSLLEELAGRREETEKRLTAASPLTRFSEAEETLRERWEDELSAAIEAEYRGCRANYLRGLEAWLRDVWITSAGLPAELCFLPGLSPATGAVAARLAPDAARENLAVVELTNRRLFSNVQETLALEVGLLRLNL